MHRFIRPLDPRDSHPAPRLALAVALLAVWWVGVTLHSQRGANRAAAAMTTAATKFLEGLTPEQRQKATLTLDSEDRTRWHYVPTTQFPRKGLPIKEMSEAQRKLAHDVLKAALSQRGYVTATAIMDLDAVLKELEMAAGKDGLMRDPEMYFFSLFGAPSPKAVWGLRVEGHHLSLHFTIGNGSVVVAAPSFFGSNPAEVREGPKKGFRALAAEQDAGRALVTALDDSQRATALINTVAPNDIVTTTAVKVDPLSPVGLSASAMTPKQRELLMQLIETYTSHMAADTADERLAQLRQAGVEKIAFAWAGPIEPGQRHYYRVQGPTFLIEFDNTQNNGNHIHSVWRGFELDFGVDLLRAHIKAAH
jgi:hypothetical protein